MRIVRMWSAVLVVALLAPLARAMPFVVELTVPNIKGWIFVSPPGSPNDPFAVGQVVLRATGDTANFAGWGYPANVRVEIPGVGSGNALGNDVVVLTTSDSVAFESPSYYSVFNMGVRAEFPEVAGYDMRTSLGPITTGSTYTHHWGPTSGMMPFALDSGAHGYLYGGSSNPGGVLRITIGGSTPNPIAARIYTDLARFGEATGPHRVATFEEGSSTASGGVSFPDGILQVLESFTEPGGTVVQTYAHWFGTMGTSPHFALQSPGGETWLEAVFPEPVMAAGFLYNCFDCSSSPLDHGLAWTTRDAKGEPIEHGTYVVDEPSPAGAQSAKPGFFGVTTTKPFSRISVQHMHAFNAAQRWVFDDVRFAATLPAYEYHHAAFDHYFVTTNADEVTKLDEGTFSGWSRTGLKFNVSAIGAPGTSPVCRLFSTAFGAKSSHFYTTDPGECALRKQDPHWQFEGDVFGMTAPDATGACANGASPLFRLYNDGHGGAPNHRYTTSPAVRQEMLQAGWIPEGAGVLGTIGCIVQ